MSSAGSKSLKRSRTDEAIDAYKQKVAKSGAQMAFTSLELIEMVRAFQHDIDKLAKEAKVVSVDNPQGDVANASVPSNLQKAKYAQNTLKIYLAFVQKYVSMEAELPKETLGEIFEILKSNIEKATSLATVVCCLSDAYQADDLLKTEDNFLKKITYYVRVRLLDSLWEQSPEDISHTYKTQQKIVGSGNPFFKNIAELVIDGKSPDEIQWGELGTMSEALKQKVLVKLAVVKSHVEKKNFMDQLANAITVDPDAGMAECDDISYPESLSGNPVEIVWEGMNLSFELPQLDKTADHLSALEEVDDATLCLAANSLRECCRNIAWARDDPLPAVSKLPSIPTSIKASKKLSGLYSVVMKNLRDSKRKQLDQFRLQVMQALNNTSPASSSALLRSLAEQIRKVISKLEDDTSRRSDLLHWHERLDLMLQVCEPSGPGGSGVRMAYMKAKGVSKEWVEKFGSAYFSSMTKEAKAALKNTVVKSQEAKEILGSVAEFAYLDPQSYSALVKIGKPAAVAGPGSGPAALDALMDGAL